MIRRLEDGGLLSCQLDDSLRKWSGQQGSNPRKPAPKAGGLPLAHAPVCGAGRGNRTHREASSEVLQTSPPPWLLSGIGANGGI